MKSLVACIVGLLLTASVSAAATGTATWQDKSTNEDGFRVYRLATGTLARTKVCDVGANIVTCQLSELPALGYCYVATAYNNAGESPDSAQACWAVPGTPGTVVIIVN